MVEFRGGGRELAANGVRSRDQRLRGRKVSEVVMVVVVTRPRGYCYVDGVKKGLSELRIAKDFAITIGSLSLHRFSNHSSL